MMRNKTIRQGLWGAVALAAVWLAIPAGAGALEPSEILNTTGKPMKMNLQYGENLTRVLIALNPNQPVQVDTRYRELGSRPCLLLPILNILVDEGRRSYTLTCEINQACHHIREPKLRWRLRMTADNEGDLFIEQNGKVLNELPCR